MNQKQIDYAVKRADAIKKNLIAHLQLTHAIPAVKLGRDDSLKALSEGSFTIRAVEEDSWRQSRDWKDYVVFDANKEASVKPGLDKKVAKVTEDHSRLVDMLMLGSESEALALLQKFEKGESLP